MASRYNIADVLRDNTHAYRACIEGWQEDDHRARLYFGITVRQKPNYPPAMYQEDIEDDLQLDLLSRVKDLQIEVTTGNHPSSVCAVQDMLFAFVHRIPVDHVLRSLQITITVKMPNDATSRNFMTADVWECPQEGLDIIHEYRFIEPGDLSRAHMIAFLTDPLKTIRNLNKGKRQKGMCTVKFHGSSGTILGDIPSKIAELVRGDAEVRDYEVFREHYAAMCDLIDSMRAAIPLASTDDETIDLTTIEPLAPLTPQKSTTIDLTTEDSSTHPDDKATSSSPPTTETLHNLHQSLATARIRGNFYDLQQAQNKLIALCDKLLELLSRSDPDSSEPGDEVHARRDMLAEKRGMVIAFLPMEEESDVSFYGYAETDRVLALDVKSRKMEKLKKKQGMEKKAKPKKKDKRNRAIEGEGEGEERDDDLDDGDSTRPRKKIERGWYGSI